MTAPARARAVRTAAPRPTERARPSVRQSARSSAVPSLATWLVGVLAVLCVTGLIMVASASSVVSIAYYGSPWAISVRECLWMVVGAAAFIAAARLETRTLGRVATISVVASLGLLVAVLAPGVGTSSFGASRWLGVGLLRIQPSELAKLALVLYAAHVVARRERTESEWGRVLRPVAVVTALSAILVLLQPDMGTAVVLVAIAVAVVTAAGAPVRAILFSVVLLVLGAAGAALALPYRRARLLSFLHPQSDPLGTGYQVIQSKTGLGVGHLFGLGLGNSREKWGLLPNPHTDFIFSIIGEELGLVGAAFVLILLFTLVLLGLRVARNAPDRFGQLTAVGISAWLAAETFVNVGAAIGVLPVTGIPLPFVSFGGTSLVIDMAAVGVLVGIARRSTPRPALRVVASSARVPTPRRSSRAPSSPHPARRARRTPHRR